MLERIVPLYSVVPIILEPTYVTVMARPLCQYTAADDHMEYGFQGVWLSLGL